MENKNKAIVISKVIWIALLIFGIVLLAVFGLCTVMSLFDAELASDGFLPVCVVFDVIGVLAIVFGRRRHQSIINYRKYMGALACDQTGSIANLAAMVGTSQEIVKANLERMIKWNYFGNAHINYDTNCIVIKNMTYEQRRGNSFSPQNPQMPRGSGSVEYITVTCPNCGGINKIPAGSVGECDYCGSPLEKYRV